MLQVILRILLAKQEQHFLIKGKMKYLTFSNKLFFRNSVDMEINF